jgi:tRNA 2-thiouridine synthesizing protein D
MAKKTLTFVMMDAPYENARTVTAMRILDAAARRGHQLNVFCYEGAVGLTFARQAAHANAVHGRDVIEEEHPLPKEWVAGLIDTASRHGGRLEWMNCGLCVDERGVGEVAPGIKRGSPADLWKWADGSDNTLVIGTR